ncbi:hypothetical protein AB0I61_17150 [Polymorphospora rubra]|uniref:hypothetical protein n=1 Tax=Polymorphospora rubra TaxID=338584 RepID=UPI0033DE46AD
MTKPNQPPPTPPRRPQPTTRPTDPPIILPKHPRYTDTAVAVLERPPAACYVCLAPTTTPDLSYGVIAPLCGSPDCEAALTDLRECDSLVRAA